MAGKTLAFCGRLMFATIFIASALQTVQQFDFKTGGPVTAYYAAPKLNAFVAKVSAYFQTPLSFPKAYIPHAVLFTKIVELVGALLFVLDVPFGAQLLSAFLVTVSPIMHNFWDMKGQEQQIEMIMFMKVSAAASSSGAWQSRLLLMAPPLIHHHFSRRPAEPEHAGRAHVLSGVQVLQVQARLVGCAVHVHLHLWESRLHSLLAAAWTRGFLSAPRAWTRLSVLAGSRS